MFIPSVQNANVSKLSGQTVLEICGVKGFLIPNEVNVVSSLAASLPKGGKYLEIGSFMGLSALVAAFTLATCKNYDARIICVDTWEGSLEHSDIGEVASGSLYSIFRDNISRSKLSPFITACRGKSTEVVTLFEDASLDLIFVDGDHTYQGCLADLNAWYPKLRLGGRFLGHDAIPHENPTCGVRSAVIEFGNDKNLELQIIEPPLAHYIWELKRKTVIV